MANCTAKKYPGPTPPLSLSTSSEYDIKLTNELKKTLASFGMYDSEETIKKRQVALKDLDNMTKEFVQLVCKRRGIPEEVAGKAGGKVFTYGSYKLGVNAADADIDTLCVFPNLVSRNDFFIEMLGILKQNRHIKDITPVSDSYVPVIKFKYDDVPIDFVCARLNTPQVPETISLRDSAILHNLDDRCIRSINGARVADDIISLVPNVAPFRIALRCIKLWATKRGIYSNMMGFFGGVAWAILVARICQLYPNACAATVISKFFRILIHWNWPSPVILKSIQDGGLLNINSALKPWNPKANSADRSHRMPIITPSYPSMCATHNVTASTQRIILGEFKIAAEAVDKIMMGKQPWSALFQSHDFFENYKHYLQIIVSSDDYENYLAWSGFVEAKLRQLVLRLEAVPAIALVHPFFEGFKYEKKCQNTAQVFAATHGKPDLPLSAKSVKKQSITIYTKVFYVGLYIRNVPEKTRTIDLVSPIFEFTRMVKSWSEFTSSRMGIVVETVKKSEIPSDVHPRIYKRGLSKSASPPIRPVPSSNENVTPSVSTSLTKVVNKKMKMNEAAGVSIATAINL